MDSFREESTEKLPVKRCTQLCKHFPTLKLSVCLKSRNPFMWTRRGLGFPKKVHMTLDMPKERNREILVHV
jgi:hypothetical protein